jgi:hypothetical protein
MTMAWNAQENVAQRRMTDWFIGAAPLDIVITRVLKERETTRGGLAVIQTQSLPPQRVRLLHAPPRRRRLENNPPDETFDEVPFAKDMLMGARDLNVMIGDLFTIGPDLYEVAYVFIDRTYETLANLQTVDQAIFVPPIPAP